MWFPMILNGFWDFVAPSNSPSFGQLVFLGGKNLPEMFVKQPSVPKKKRKGSPLLMWDV